MTTHIILAGLYDFNATQVRVGAATKQGRAWIESKCAPGAISFDVPKSSVDAVIASLQAEGIAYVGTDAEGREG